MNKDDSMKPLVSIIMPAYNCEKYIEKAINSVIRQTYKQWELIIVDDCSNDRTVNHIEVLSKLDTRIKFYKNDCNIGVSETRNKAISLANGNWIAFLDSDDMWETSKLEKQCNLLKNKNVEFIFTGASYINEKGEAYNGIFEVPEVIDYKKLRMQNVISCSSVLIKKKYFDEIKMENDNIHEDYAVWLRVLKTGIKAYGINEPLLIYRISSNSKSGNKIKTIRMTYKVFEHIGLNKISSMYFTIRHIMGATKKYIKIKYRTIK